jgi:membrane-associated protease RseP (regulator of RpoE activity)
VKSAAGWTRALAALVAASQLGIGGAGVRIGQAWPAADSAAASTGESSPKKEIVIQTIETAPPGGSTRRERPWLGVSTEEATEALTAQLGLDPAVGLVVAYVATNSPAAKAGLQKNDVLVEFEGQALVHPAQLRKLVQARKEGDAVKLVFYRAGKRQTATATLAKTRAGFGLLEDEHAWHGDLSELGRQLQELPIGDAVRQQMKVLRKTLGNVKIDHQVVQEEVRRGMEEARKAIQEALQQVTNQETVLKPVQEALAELSRSGILVDNDATVTVRTTGQKAKSIVKTDDSGTLVIVANPKLHLTAHDKDGQLLFDGEIETLEQRAKVPPAVWHNAEPLLEKMTPGADAEPAPDPSPSPSADSSCGSASDRLLTLGWRQGLEWF